VIAAKSDAEQPLEMIIIFGIFFLTLGLHRVERMADRSSFLKAVMLMSLPIKGHKRGIGRMNMHLTLNKTEGRVI